MIWDDQSISIPSKSGVSPKCYSVERRKLGIRRFSAQIISLVAIQGYVYIYLSFTGYKDKTIVHIVFRK